MTDAASGWGFAPYRSHQPGRASRGGRIPEDYATGAAAAAVHWAAQAGYRRVRAGVRKQTGASLRVLKRAFVDTGRDEMGAVHGDSMGMAGPATGAIVVGRKTFDGTVKKHARTIDLRGRMALHLRAGVREI